MKKVEKRISFTIGEEAKLTRVITSEDIRSFAQLTGDMNPLHIDGDYAKSSYFRGRIAHGMFISSLISSILGNELPGHGSIYQSQELKFLAPVRPGDEITARVLVQEWNPNKGKITLLTDVVNQDNDLVITGQAKLVISAFL